MTPHVNQNLDNFNLYENSYSYRSQEAKTEEKDNLYLAKEKAQAKFLKTRKEEDKIKAFKLQCE
jgi:hypothetical protein